MTQKISQDELFERLQSARQQVKVGAQYKHYKGDMYLVTDLVIQTIDAEVCVIYQALYGKKLTFARPLAEWLEDVVVDDKTLQRFALTT